MGCWDHLGEQPLEHEIGIKSVYQALGLLSICGQVTGQLTLLRHGRSGVCSFWSVSVGRAPPLTHLSMTICHACFLCLRLRAFFSPQTRSQFVVVKHGRSEFRPLFSFLNPAPPRCAKGISHVLEGRSLLPLHLAAFVPVVSLIFAATQPIEICATVYTPSHSLASQLGSGHRRRDYVHHHAIQHATIHTWRGRRDREAHHASSYELD